VEADEAAVAEVVRVVAVVAAEAVAVAVRARVAALDLVVAHAPRWAALRRCRAPGQVPRSIVPPAEATQIGRETARDNRLDNCLRQARGPREASTGRARVISLEIDQMLVVAPARPISLQRVEIFAINPVVE